jgi:FkbM family methyltransferase
MFNRSLIWIRKGLIHLGGVSSIEDHFYLPWLLSHQSKVVDAGANFGRFSQAIVNRHSCEIIAIEPEESNFTNNSPNSRIILKRVALAGKSGKAILSIDVDSTAHRLSGDTPLNGDEFQEVECQTLEAILTEAEWETLDLLKLDIEGMEWEVFASLSDSQLSCFVQITVEFHDFAGLCPKSDATWKVYQRLARLGFLEIEDPVGGSYNTLFVKANCLPVSMESLALVALQWVVRLSRKWGRLETILKSRFENR